MTEPRLCKDCRWATNPGAELAPHPLFPNTRRRVAGPRDWVCTHSTAARAGQPDLVLGLPVPPWQDGCVSVRRDPNRCGVTGRFWEARE
jgi:hypothetical protein